MSFWDNERNKKINIIDNSDENEPDWQDLDDFTTISHNGMWAMIHTDDAESWEDMLNAIEELEIKGFEFIAYSGTEILMRQSRKGEMK